MSSEQQTSPVTPASDLEAVLSRHYGNKIMEAVIDAIDAVETTDHARRGDSYDDYYRSGKKDAQSAIRVLLLELAKENGWDRREREADRKALMNDMRERARSIEKNLSDIEGTTDA